MDDLKALRQQIDEIDDQLMALLDKRFKLSKAVGIYKQQHNVPVLHTDRETDIYNKTSKYSAYPQIKNVYKCILTNSKDIQKP